MDHRDALLAEVNLIIYRKVLDKTNEMVCLKDLKYIHKLERDNALVRLQERIEVLQKHKDNILINNTISADSMTEYLPSISLIKVVKDQFGHYLIFEGNGRIAAIKDVFDNHKEIFIEVQEFHFKNKKSILKKLHYLMKINGLLSKDKATR